MNLFRRWLWPRSPRNEALAFYKEGMACAERQDSKAAMGAYTSAIEQPNAPDDVKAMALYNRALLFAAEGNTKKAQADLQAVMEMPIPLHDVKQAARRRLERLQNRADAAAREKRSTAL